MVVQMKFRLGTLIKDHYLIKYTYMSDNKNKTGHPDRNLINFKQRYEFDYAVNQLRKQFPGETKQEVKRVLTEAARKISPSEGREKIMREARKKLG
jgi:hypothetical protein